MLSYFGLAVSLVPRALTFRDAASPPATQAFILIGVIVLLPLVLAYTVDAYRVFRHKVSRRKSTTSYAPPVARMKSRPRREI